MPSSLGATLAKSPSLNPKQLEMTMEIVYTDDGRELNNNALQDPSGNKQPIENAQAETVPIDESPTKDAEVDKPIHDPESVDIPSHASAPDQAPLPGAEVKEELLEDPHQAEKSLQDPHLFNSWQKNPLSSEESPSAAVDNPLQDQGAVPADTSLSAPLLDEKEKPLDDPAPIDSSLQDSTPVVDKPLEDTAPVEKLSLDEAPVEDLPQDPEPVVETLQDPAVIESAQPATAPAEDVVDSAVEEKPLEVQPPTDSSQLDLLDVNESLLDSSILGETVKEIAEETPAKPLDDFFDAPSNTSDHPTLSTLADPVILENTPVASESRPIDESVIDLATACGQESVLLDEISYFQDANAYVMAEQEDASVNGSADATPVQPQRSRAVVDSKTITKTSKKATQKLPEAVVAPLKQETAPPEVEEMAVADTDRSANVSTENESLYMDAEAFHQEELDPLDGDDLLNMKTPSASPHRAEQQHKEKEASVIKEAQTTVVKKKPTTDRSYLMQNADASAIGAELEAITLAAKQSECISSDSVASLSLLSLDQIQLNESDCVTSATPVTTTELPFFDISELKEVTGADSKLIDEVANKLQLQFKTILLSKEREYTSKEHKLSQALEKKEYELKMEKRENAVNKQNAAEMSVVVAEYEKTLGQLMSQMESGKRVNGVAAGSPDADSLLKERNQLAEELQSMENSFGDMYRRYEKLRQATEDLRKNEDTLKQSVDDYQQKLKRAEDRFTRLREHAEDKLEKANQEIERLMKARDTDTIALRAKLKQRDAQVDALERSLEAKQREIQELTSICDELIQKAANTSDSELS
uniref:Transforming acidic coiled-coil-containing protein C-terminal domain-containing protein n=2 Tax=Plectus sambesii TaxID=2011161 RepID=A0A914VVT6_9BILA